MDFIILVRVCYLDDCVVFFIFMRIFLKFLVYLLLEEKKVVVIGLDLESVKVIVDVRIKLFQLLLKIILKFVCVDMIECRLRVKFLIFDNKFIDVES